MAINYGLENVLIVDSEKEPFIPFAFIGNQNKEISLERFLEETEKGILISEELIEKSKKGLLQNNKNSIMSAFIHDGFLTFEGKKENALICTGYDFLNKKIFEFGLMYKIVKPFFGKKKVEEIGNMKIIGVEKM